MTFIEMLPVAIYILLIILLIILIILGIKVILIVDKTNKLVDDIQGKVSSFDSIFKLVNITSEKFSSIIVGVVECIMNFVNKIINRRKDDKSNE